MRNVLEWLERDEREYPGKLAFADPQTSATYAQITERARRAGLRP